MCRRKRCGGDSAPKVGIFVAIVPGATVILEHAQPCTQARAGPLRLAQLPLRPEILLGTWVLFHDPEELTIRVHRIGRWTISRKILGKTAHGSLPTPANLAFQAHRRIIEAKRGARKLSMSILLASGAWRRKACRGRGPDLRDCRRSAPRGRRLLAWPLTSGSWPRPTESPGAWASGAWPRRTGWLFLGRVALHC